MSGGEDKEAITLEYTPTWIVALVCFVIVFISLVAERLLRYLGKFLKKKNQKALYEALLKVKEELMLLGFISLLMTVLQASIRRICIPVVWTKHMLPCALNHESEKGKTKHFVGVVRHLLSSEGVEDHCTKEGKVPLLSQEALHQLHIFIFVLAVTHVVFSALTILFAGAKMRQWKNWEESIHKKDTGRGWHTYFWIAFTPLILLLALGTKLEHIITQLAHEVAEKHSCIEGELVVNPSDEHFWFNRPRIVLHLIHFIFFQNAFQIAFFIWILTTFGRISCIMDMGKAEYIIPWFIIGVIVQILCSYSTLPLYAIVTQMGTSVKKEIFEQHADSKPRTSADIQMP